VVVCVHIFCIRFFVILLAFTVSSNALAANGENTKLKILHVMSYHQSWEWNTDQFQGFKDGLGDLDVEYKVVELDTKRESAPESIATKASLAKTIIADWKPDLLYTNDDNAQQYVAKDYVGTKMPIVFSAVNRDPSEYGFSGSPNVTGVMEYEHIVPTISLLRQIKNDVHRIAVIIDDDPTWTGVIERMRKNLEPIQDLDDINLSLLLTFEDYKNTIIDLQDKADAIALLGVFNLKDQNGKDVSYEEVLKWTAENSHLPDFSFWESRIEQGTLCAVAVSGYEQGHLAGVMARQILHDNVSPSAIEMSPSLKGEPMISLSRAKDLGIDLDVQILLSSTVKNKYDWNDE